MKINYLKLLGSFFFIPVAVAQTPVSIDIKQFCDPVNANYIEVYSSVEPASFVLEHKKDSGLFCNLEELIVIRQEEKIIDFRKKNIRSPFYSDSTVSSFAMVERFVLKPGKYVLEYECTDLLKKDASPLKAEFIVDIADRYQKTAISQIELTERISSSVQHPELARSGYEIWPFVSNFFPDFIEKIAYYAELYFSPDDVTNQEKFILTQYITNFETSDKIEGFAKMSKVSASQVYPIINSFDIKKLPTGNYNLVIELRDKKNEPVAKETIFFQRLNMAEAMNSQNISATSIEGTFVDEINNVDTLNDFIGCVRPIASNVESDMALLQMKDGNPLSKKQFFYLFWKNRAPGNPEGAWHEYREQVKKVNKLFGTRIRKGYETDRGRIYLKYGPPNSVTDRPNEPSAYPYQIWQYYKAGKYNNKFFMFYMPDLVSNDYEVLNSDIPGEYKNPNWQAALYKRDSSNPNIDFPNQNNADHYGGNVNELQKNPR